MQPGGKLNRAQGHSYLFTVHSVSKFHKIPFPDSPAPTSALRFRLLKKYSILQTITQRRQEQTMPLIKIIFLKHPHPFIYASDLS